MDLTTRPIEATREPAAETAIMAESPGGGSPQEIRYGDEPRLHDRAGHPREQPETAIPISTLVSLGGELIGAVERGVNASGEDFGSLFNRVRLELTDDFSFLDPMANELTYANGVASLEGEVPETIFVAALSEALRRVVDKVAVGERMRRVRERIALELLGVARRRKEALELSAFRKQLDRIAGTKVI
jgi:hypothetical protein